MNALRPRHVVFFAAVALTSGCAALSTQGGLVNGNLRECPSAPHCVSSLASDERHRTEPFQLATPQSWTALVDVVRGSERTSLVAVDDRYVHAEVVSPWHFYTDDLELLRSPDGRVDVRSSSRVGYYDFNVNRKRVEALRRQLRDASVINGR